MTGSEDRDATPVAIVTGAASGIGAAFARQLAAAGEIVLLVDRDADALEATVRTIAANGGQVEGVVADLTTPSPLRTAVERAGALGPLRTACFNAGVSTTGPPIWETSDDTFDFALNVNLRGLVRSIRDTVPAMIAHGGRGRVIITASMAGLVASPNSAAYAASKAGAIAIARALRGELAAAAPQMSVTVLNPGMVKTNLARTSAAQQTHETVPTELVEMVHGALNAYGLEPDAIAEMALDASARSEFWVLPPEGDPFRQTLREELGELNSAITGV